MRTPEPKSFGKESKFCICWEPNHKLLVVHSVCMLIGFPRSYEYVINRSNTFVEKSCSWKSIRPSILQRNIRLSQMQIFLTVLHWNTINLMYLANDPILYHVSTLSYRKQPYINLAYSHIFRTKSATGRKFINSLHSLFHEIYCSTNRIHSTSAESIFQDPLNSVLPFTLWFTMCILPFEFTDQHSVKHEWFKRAVHICYRKKGDISKF